MAKNNTTRIEKNLETTGVCSEWESETTDQDLRSKRVEQRLVRVAE